MEYFKPYEGDKPYIFISYAHADSPAVMEVVGKLHDRGYRIWYDEGIEVGSEWPECIASHLAGAHLVIAFISNSYMRSDNCRREMHYALTKRVKIINIFLENAEMTPGMEMQIGNIFALMKHSMSEKLFYEKLYAAPLLNSEPFAETGDVSEQQPPAKAAKPAKKKEKPPKPPKPIKTDSQRKRKKRRLIALPLLVLILAAVITLGIVGHFTGLTQRIIIRTQISSVEPLPMDTVAEFQNDIFERAAREYTGIESGELRVYDLAGITELYIVGNEFWFEDPTAELAARASLDPGQEKGTVSTLHDLAFFTGLDTLWLVDQQLGSLATMPSSNIEYLNISGCKVSSLQGIGSLVKLRELVTDGCPVSDLGNIDHCLMLRKISLIDSRVSDFSAMKPLTKLTDFAVSNCATDEMAAVMGLSSLTHVSFYNCDLRGRFFKAFDRERTMVSLELVDCELNSTVNLDDFSDLTNFTLIRSGADLDWSQLAALPSLHSVTVDESCYEAVNKALSGTQVKIAIVD